MLRGKNQIRFTRGRSLAEIEQLAIGDLRVAFRCITDLDGFFLLVRYLSKDNDRFAECDVDYYSQLF